jgi:hypothetical protein
MTAALTRRSALIVIPTLAAGPASGQAAPAAGSKNNAELVELERPAAFEVVSHSGSLKETAQGGQELTWHRKDKPVERRFQLTNISIAFLRSETGGQIKMTFSCNITSFGYSVDEARLNVIVRSKGGAALHTWSIAVAVKCEDKNQSLTPLAQVVPTDVASNVFNHVGTVELTEYTEPNFPGIKVRRCD